MVTAALRSVFAQETAAEIESRWDDLAASLAERFPKAAALMHEAKEDVLAFRHFPKDHWRKIWSTNLLERVNEEIIHAQCIPSGLEVRSLACRRMGPVPARSCLRRSGARVM
jgi:transposase-like protein